MMSTKSITVGYTIYNKAHLIPNIVEGIRTCFSPEDEIIMLYDKCDDGSMGVGVEATAGSGMQPVRHIYQPNEMFEVKANNEVLRLASNDIIILFQDDMVCKDLGIRDKIIGLVEEFGDSLGLMGGRDGFEFDDLSFPERPVHKLSSWAHDPNTKLMKDGDVQPRTVLNRGPIVFTRRLLDQVGYLDESYYPLWGDDMDYCCRAKFHFGLQNYVFKCDIESPLSWGTTRSSSKLRRQLPKIFRKNWNLFISRWGDGLLKACEEYENTTISE